MTEYGKHGKPRNRLSTLPTLFGNPCGITTFPEPRLLAYFKMQDQERPNPRPLDHKGVVMEVPGPKCNGCSGTLTPLGAGVVVFAFQNLGAGVAGRNETVSKLYAPIQLIAGPTFELRTNWRQLVNTAPLDTISPGVIHKGSGDSGRPWSRVSVPVGRNPLQSGFMRRSGV
jgi:hypothetical protein